MAVPTTVYPGLFWPLSLLVARLGEFLSVPINGSKRNLCWCVHDQLFSGEPDGV